MHQWSRQWGHFSGGANELIRIGAKNIYANDLDKTNLMCMNRYIGSTMNNKLVKVHYLAGDITSSFISKKIPNHAFGLILAKNVIHFMSYDQLIRFIELSNSKLENGGMEIIIFANPYLKELNVMALGIFQR